jgi:tetratricopeptide (TPR) repeat protein
MVSWGLGHNLEKNLERVQSLRAKGQLDKALKSLQEWAEKHPDTPHYQFEAAMVAFELKDFNTGLNALRSLVRKLPETREKVLGACREQFAEVPALPLAEYLTEQALFDHDLQNAMDLVSRLDADARRVLLKKLEMRQRTQAESEEPMPPKVLHGLIVQFLLGCSLPAGGSVRSSIPHLVAESDFPAREWTKFVARALELDPQDTDLLVAHAHALAAENKFDLAGESLIRAARLNESEIERCLDLLQGFQPDEAGRGSWYYTEGHLHLLRQDGAAAAESWRHAADAAPKLRESLLEGLARPSENSSLPGREEALKLRLRLLVVQKHFDEIPELARRLVADGLAEPGELRALLGEGQDQDLPTEMTAVLAEIALRDGDIVAAAGFAYEIPTSDDHSCRRLLRAIDSMIDDWPEETRLQLFALRAVLRARIKDRNGANSALAEAWRAYPDELETLTAVSERCLEDVDPLPESVAAALAAGLDGDQTDWIRTPFLLLCPEKPAGGKAELPSGELTFDGMDHGSYGQDSLTLELGEDGGEDFATDLIPMIRELLREKPERGEAFLRFFDGLGRADLEPVLRHPVAMAALFAGESGRALPTYALLTMMAETSFLEETADDFDIAVENQPENVSLLLARGELDLELNRLESAAERFDQALRLDPAQASAVVEGFDRMLEVADADQVPTIQLSLAEALFEVRAFERLAELCQRVLAQTEGSQSVPYLALRVRMATARGEFSAALQLIQQHTVKGPMPAAIGVGLLEEILAAHPGSSISWLMLGQLATRASMLPRALEAYVEATRIDPSLEQPVAEQIHEISSLAEVTTDLLLGVARFHLQRKAPDRAAYALSRILELDTDEADRVLGKLSTALSQEQCSLDLLAIAARACRLAGQPRRTVEMLMEIDDRDPQRLETVLAELRNLREDYPDESLAAASMAEVLWRHDSPEAAGRIAREAATVETYPLHERIEMLREFHQRGAGSAGVALALAGLLAENGERSEACDLIEACISRDDFDPDRAAEVTGRLHRRFPDHAGLALLHHDLLVRCGRIDEALRILPPARALPDQHVAEVNARFEQHRSHVVVDADLALQFGQALVRADRADAALEIFEAAASGEIPPSHPLLMEWAGLLHAQGDAEKSAAILQQWFEGEEQRREAYAAFGRWTEQRRNSELETMRGRFADDPQDFACALSIAANLLEFERAKETCEFLSPLDGDDRFRPRRAILLGRAHLQLDRAEAAQAILLDAMRGISEDHEDFGEIQYRLAECAGRLGRPDEATARLRGLLADSRYADQARARVRTTYAHHLSEAAGERRAVLTAVSSLVTTPSRNER